MTREEQDYKNFTDCVEEAMKRLCHIWRGHEPQDGIIVQGVGFDGKTGYFSGIYEGCVFYASLAKTCNGTLASIDATDVPTGTRISSFIESGSLSDVVKEAIWNLREHQMLEKERKEWIKSLKEGR